MHAHTSLVRPLVNYSTTTWTPYLKKDIAAIESIQRKAARIVMADYRRTSSVSTMLQQLKWIALEEQKLTNDIVFFYKIQNKLMNIDFPAEVQMYHRSGRLHHQSNYRQVSARINSYKNSFFVRTISLWNKLPACVINTSNVLKFKEQATRFIVST